MGKPVPAEVSQRADFSIIRYAQCWEDADILLEALDIKPGDRCLSIASAGDNSLAMLSKNPGEVVALDLNPAQLACLELRVAAYRSLSHTEMLELIGSLPSDRRSMLFDKCKETLSKEAREFWEMHSLEIGEGFGSTGKFENYFSLFRNRILPLIHSNGRVLSLFQNNTVPERERFYEGKWNNWRWKLLFRIFFSRTVMGRLGRDPSFFTYVNGSVSDRILSRARYALTQLNPNENPYLQWILLGTHKTALPYSLRPENFEAIRKNLNRLAWRCESLEDFLDRQEPGTLKRFNLSDIFEYMSVENYQRLLEKIIRAGAPGGRLAYWNMLAPRHRPEILSGRLRPLEKLSAELHLKDKAFFYSAFVVEELT